MNEIPIDTVIRENIKHLRKQLGWSQELLAEKTGVSAPYITQIEVGKRTPSLDIVEKLASALGVSYERLFKAEKSNKTDTQYALHLLEKDLIQSITDIIQTKIEKTEI